MSTEKKLIIALAVVVALMGAAFVGEAVLAPRGPLPYGGGIDYDGFYTNSTSTSGSSIGSGATGTVCTQEAKLCPDGSYVGRTGPNCEFVCPEARPGGPLLTGELVGQVTFGPTCPVEQNPPDPQCSDKPYQTTVIVSTGGREVGRQTTGADGRFMFSFLPGTYSVTAVGGATLPRCPSQSVTLQKAATTTVSLMCDTGIR